MNTKEAYSEYTTQQSALNSALVSDSDIKSNSELIACGPCGTLNMPRNIESGSLQSIHLCS